MRRRENALKVSVSADVKVVGGGRPSRPRERRATLPARSSAPGPGPGRGPGPGGGTPRAPEQTRQAWAQKANQALEQAGREERIDGHSLADARDAAYEAGARARAAELSRKPNVHLDPLAVKKELRAAVAGEPPDDAGVQRSYDVKDRNRALARERAEPDEQHEAEQKRISWLERELRGAAADVRQAAEEFDMQEFKLRQSYEKLDKAITGISGVDML